ncbi:hypothetical protein [Vogesella indigofera]|uniref:Uncharacterized protein n=1 Tax=Vogesella indigofera TaxID=45465 RepID=A0ABT5I8U2_VOGIN|nr:hypothetical protein [Vogesella indigofera]MDC7692604.1 hypothetical protein [Vogesella indigofera]
MITKEAVVQRCERTREELWARIIKVVTPFLPDTLRFRLRMGEVSGLEIITTSSEEVIWAFEYRYKISFFAAGDDERALASEEAILAIHGEGEVLETRLVFEDQESAIRNLCARLLAREPFVQYEWIRDTYDSEKFHLMADDKKVQSIWRISPTSKKWGSLMGITFDSKLSAMGEALRSSIYMRASELTSRLLA